jgi:hypothetical protein
MRHEELNFRQDKSVSCVHGDCDKLAFCFVVGGAGISNCYEKKNPLIDCTLEGVNT